MNVVGFTACFGGMVRNHLAAVRLVEAAKQAGISLRLEVHEAEQVSAPLSLAELSVADMAIIASDDSHAEIERFEAIPTFYVSTREAVKDPKRVLAQASHMLTSGDGKAHIERRLFISGAGRAIAAYLGALYGLQTTAQAMAQPDIRNIVHGAMNEGGAVLARRYGFGAEDHARYVEMSMSRLAHAWRPLAIAELAAEPMRKLGRNERLIRPLLAAREYGLPHENLAYGVAAALHYVAPGDEQSLRLHEWVLTKGVRGTLEEICGEDLGLALAGEIEKYWSTLRERIRT